MKSATFEFEYSKIIEMLKIDVVKVNIHFFICTQMNSYSTFVCKCVHKFSVNIFKPLLMK